MKFINYSMCSAATAVLDERKAAIGLANSSSDGRASVASTPFPSVLQPPPIRYIKLGARGAWEGSGLDGGRLEWGDAANPFTAAAAGA
ncbi:MAG: hypothetical protein EON59_13890 [Alphaproteobacteria bacterium]|nr:MAG: hypothetical protein EON59_13890 [Alphaproteobacteria bacterium]